MIEASRSAVSRHLARRGGRPADQADGLLGQQVVAQERAHVAWRGAVGQHHVDRVRCSTKAGCICLRSMATEASPGAMPPVCAGSRRSQPS